MTTTAPASTRLYGATAACALLAAAPLAAADSSAAGEIPDPTRPSRIPAAEAQPAAPEPAQDWTLSATLVSRERRIATINGEVVAVGDRIGGAEILEIQPHAVTLRTGAPDNRTLEIALASAQED